jgi:hypothetical protein
VTADSEGEISGARVPEHVSLRLPNRAAATLNRVLGEIEEDEQFPLNEYEEEVVRDIRRIIGSG